MITILGKKRKKIFRGEKIFQFFLLGLLLAFIGVLTISILKIDQRRRELRKKLLSLKEEMINLEEESSELEAGISQTKKESYWEEKIRQEGYIREGENPVVILPFPQSQKEKILPSQTLSEKRKNFFASIEVFLSQIFKKIAQ